VMMNVNNHVDMRRQAQDLVQDWVSMTLNNRPTAAIVTAAKTAKNIARGDSDDEEEADLDEAEEVDHMGRKVRKLEPSANPLSQGFNAINRSGMAGLNSTGTAISSSSNNINNINNLSSPLDDVAAQQQLVKKTEAEISAIWQPSEKERQEYDRRRHEVRHAKMPMLKPTFTTDCLPTSMAPPKRKFKEDPNSSVGKITATLNKITNPNKKAWRNAIDGVSISGRGIQYSW